MWQIIRTRRARYSAECDLLDKHAEIMCAALNRSEAERLPKE